MSPSNHHGPRSPMSHRRALVADDESNTRRALRELLDEAGYEVETASGAAQAMDLVEGFAPDLVVADVELPHIGDPHEVAALAGDGQSPAVLILLARRELASAAVRGLAAGADGYLLKPVDGDLLRLLAERLVDDRRLRAWVAAVRTRLGACRALRQLVGASSCMQAVREALAQAVETCAPMLISGESGTGKLLAAGLLHECRSPGAPFVSAGCAGMSELELARAIERAAHGSLYLVEVADLPAATQGILADFLAGRLRLGGAVARPGARRGGPALVAATRRDLAGLVGAGEFSGELFQLLRPISVVMPPLRERQCDIPLLADYFLRRSTDVQPADGAVGTEQAPLRLAALVDRVWHGNVRELRSFVETRSWPAADAAAADAAADTAAAGAAEARRARPTGDA